MIDYYIEWLNLLGRWAHVITGIAWIGASFYFVWLDNHLEAPKEAPDADKGVSGELWAVHGGGFYHAQKYQVAPGKLPTTLHWFKWEAYTTWISGMFMLSLMYWYGAELYLIDPGVAELSKPVAIAIGIATIVFGWVAYDIMCKSRIGQSEVQMAIVMLVVLTLLAYGLCQVFSGRGAFMHFGAMLGTIMVGNVFFVIIPGQKDLVLAKQEGRTPDPIHGIRGKQRSVHNTYFTLPVLFVMFSNHYAMTYGHQYNWLVLIGISLVGALIRVYFVARHKGKASLIPIVLALLILLAVIYITAPKPVAVNAALSATENQTVAAAVDPVTDEQALAIIESRCTNCHAQVPSYPGFAAAPKGVVLETAANIQTHAQAIYVQTVVSKAMPLANLTKITKDERAQIALWYKQIEKGDSGN